MVQPIVGKSVLSIAYASVATTPMSDEDIAGVLVQARGNNQRHELTGALLYRGGRFVQILEGPEESVRSRFAVIAVDPRHTNVQLLREVHLSQRQFPEWTMGFRPRDDSAIEKIDGFEDFFGRTGRARLEHADNEAQQFLEWLGEYWLPRTPE